VKWRILLGVGVLVAAGLVWVWNAGSEIIAGYSAKMLCSCVFVAERSEESCLAEDLGAYREYFTHRVDREFRWVELFALGFRAARAEPVASVGEGGGCTLQ